MFYMIRESKNMNAELIIMFIVFLPDFANYPVLCVYPVIDLPHENVPDNIYFASIISHLIHSVMTSPNVSIIAYHIRNIYF